tara:strand:+ start:6515 stop:7411 length:897 start_codon:yes stop_codon:yes gene_type:complete
MSETMTYDAGTDTVTTADTLTPDEQESLKVGEEMENQQEQLLAGKYKDAEELEKAYVELQKKLGEDQTQEPEPESTPESTTDLDPEAGPGNSYNEDGTVNYTAVNDTYGSQLGDLFKANDVNPWEISKHFHENEGTITDDMYQTLESAGLSRAAIDTYLSGRAEQMGYTDGSSDPNDVTQSEINDVQASVGGLEAYTNITTWAGQNLDKASIDAYDSIVESGDVNAIKMAVAGLKAQYETANGYEGRMLTGKAPKSSAGDVFRSQPELVAAMSDPRYDRDPAYREDIKEKLDRSDLNF